MNRRFLLGAMAATVFAPAAFAQDMPVFFQTDGAVMAGYDAVSYFTEDTPRLGLPEFSVKWKGAEWHFASAENRDAFEMNPRAYAPQFGGYCAYAMAMGELVSTDPKLWTVIDGRLYLTHSPGIEQVWNTDTAEYIRMAEAHWPTALYEQ
ncbi:YHS domain protein [Ruegeria sp. THAF57]|uniref:YHS domain-containing (seleno)protein n=1 Tax=Ruegeria sp. THAF57 TaxID=2744555 RepID=UPI0017637F58|nr:YHS domain-containing (seleno)protein [Ruegeria sp. THAF57]CAD0183617.1 YHS domain protein [Ruegeria sp. THAF57]